MTGQQSAFDDRDGSIWFDGEIIPWRDARVHVLTHALHYGSSVFEGQRAYNGEVFKLSEHTERLHQSARILGFEIPWTSDEINAACKQVLKISGFKDAYMRPVAWRGAESMGVAPGHTRPHLSIAAWEWGKYYDPRHSEKGIRLDIASWRRPAPYTAPTAAKAAGLYMICTLSKQHAEDRGFNDALMFDWRGRVAESTGANVFFVENGRLHTPVPDCFLDGITRRTVMYLARRRGVEVIEREIWPEEMEGFEQMFLTGTAVEVTPVQSAGPWSFEVGDLTRQLSKDYDDLVNGRIPNT
jgi:branched-chain amino acid aminotransferase